MENITIKAKDFFELLKLKDVSMWDIFEQMIDGQEKKIIFISEDQKPIFNYTLPKDKKQLAEDKKLFTKEYMDKIAKN